MNLKIIFATRILTPPLSYDFFPGAGIGCGYGCNFNLLLAAAVASAPSISDSEDEEGGENELSEGEEISVDKAVEMWNNRRQRSKCKEYIYVVYSKGRSRRGLGITVGKVGIKLNIRWLAIKRGR